MRILFAASHPPVGGVAFGGVASWAFTLSKELSLRGHECVLWGPSQRKPEKRFDVGVISNVQKTSRALDWCEWAVTVSHGIVDEEKPDSNYMALSTSDEVRERWKIRGPVLAQPIDLRFWRPKEGKKRKLVFYSYRAQGVFDLDKVAGALGLEFLWLKNVDAKAARFHLQNAALVAASGRAALEAMACDAPTMICDWRPYNGAPLICQNLDIARRHNYSGRGGVDPAKIDIAQFGRETMAFQQPRKYIETHHDSVNIATDLMEVLQSA